MRFVLRLTVKERSGRGQGIAACAGAVVFGL